MSEHAAVGRSVRPSEARSQLGKAWQRFHRNRAAMFYLVLFGLFFALAFAAQLVVFVQDRPFTHEQTLRDLGLGFEETAYAPTAEHWLASLGTTSAGKSVLLRVFQGTRVAFFVGTFGAGLAVLIGMTLGLFAGYLGRWVDQLIVYLYTTVASIPYLLLMLAVAFVVRHGPLAEAYRGLAISEYMSLGLFNIIVVIGLTSWVTLCRLVRAEVMKVRELEYVQAARSLGLGDLAIMFRHVLPNVFHLVIINFSLTFVVAIKSEVILTFLGVGVEKEPSWGQMIADAKSELMRGIWWPLLASGVALFLLTLAVNHVGDALRDALDPKLRSMS